MDDQFFIRPAVDGARVEDPETGDVLKSEGEWKPRTPHWVRQQLRCDIVVAEPVVEPEPGYDLTAVHRGNGSYSVMRGGDELLDRLTKTEADEFNALEPAARAAFVTDQAAAA